MAKTAVAHSPRAGDPVFPGAPGTAGTPAARLHGRFAQVSVGSILLLCFEWELEVQQEFADGTAHGDYWFNPIPITQRWTARVRGYLTNSAAILIASPSQASSNPPYTNALFAKTTTGPEFTLTCYSDATPTKIIFEGQAYASRGRVLVPDAMVTQEMELTGIGPPTEL